MTDPRDAAEALARARGVQPRGLDVYSSPSRWTLTRVENGSVLEHWAEGPSGGAHARYELTSTEAMLWLRLYMLPPTRVRCPDCEGAKRQWSVGSDFGPDGAGWEITDDRDADGSPWWTRPCPTCTGPAVECPGPGEYYGTPVTCEGGWLQPHVIIGYGRSCPTCNPGNTGLAKGTIPGAPTGYVSRSWAEVFLAARPRECPECQGQGGGCHVSDDDPPIYRVWMCEGCGGVNDHGTHEDDQPGTGMVPGDPEARTLLTEQLRDLEPNLDVLGDWVMDGRDLAAFPEGPGMPELVRHLGPDWSRWVALWLAGAPCEVCEGSGDCQDNVLHMGDCTPCRGTGHALGAHHGAMAEAGLELAAELVE